MSARHRRILEVFAGAAGMTPAEFEQRCIELTPHTENGRAVAAVIFYRACDYWTDFFDLEDQDALVTWAAVFDQYEPLITPDIAERAVDALHAAGAPSPQLAEFLAAARRIMETES